MNKKLLFTLMLTFSLTGSIHAQNAYLSGTITDDFGELLPGVTIEVKGFGSTYTDEDGYFLFPLQSGTYDIEFRYLGLDNHKITAFHVAGNTVRQLDVVMNAYSNWLSEVLIVAPKVPLLECSVTTYRYTYICDRQWATSIVQRTSSENDSTGVTGGISLYPNPADTHTQIELAVPANEVAIFDAKGALVHRVYDLAAGIYEIPVQDLPAGMYTVWASTTANTQHIQLVIAH